MNEKAILLTDQQEFPVIIAETSDFAVICKPAGWVANDADSASGPTIQSWWWQRLVELQLDSEAGWPKNWLDQVGEYENEFGSPKEIFKSRRGLVHRLDKDTSGLMVLAKHPGSLVELLRQFREREVQKEYSALVHGKFAELSGEITAPIGRLPWQRTKFGVVAGGRPAVTNYTVEREYCIDINRLIAAAKERKLFAGRPAAKLAEQLSDYIHYTLLRCTPKTGRTHQIRVHCQHIGHPLVSDSLYLGKKRIRLDEMWCPRHFLHAALLSFTDPSTIEKCTFESAVPDELQRALGWLTQ